MPRPGRSAQMMPLDRDDPPALGEAVLTGRLEVSDAGILYAAMLGDEAVVVALLTAGAEVDSFARARFSDAVHAASLNADSPVVAVGDEPEIAPWVAVGFGAGDLGVDLLDKPERGVERLGAGSWDDGVKAAAALLAPVTLDGLTPVGTTRGPGFRPHWADRPGPGRWRAWPLPWPAALSAAGRWTYVASFALMVAIASIALFIAVQVFENQPPAPIGPPFVAPTMPTPTSTPTPTLPSPPSVSGAPRTTLRTIPPIV